MGTKVLPDMSIHKEASHTMEPYTNYAQHDVDGIDWQHPPTHLFEGLEAPPMVHSDLLDDQRAAHGHPRTHSPVDTTLRFYTDQDIKRSCPSV